MAKPYLSIILTAHAGERQLPVTLAAVDGFLDKVDYSAEVIIVDYGLTEDASAAALVFKKFIRDLKILRNEKSGSRKVPKIMRFRDRNSAILRGLIAAKGNLRLVVSASDIPPLSEFDKFIPRVAAEKYEAVFGARKAKGLKRFAIYLSSLIVRVFKLGRHGDPLCEFKCFTEETAEKLTGLLEGKWYGFDLEVLILAKKLNLRVGELKYEFKLKPKEVSLP